MHALSSVGERCGRFEWFAWNMRESGEFTPGGDEDGIRELATRLFAMARDGDAAGLAAYLDAGVPANLANEKGDTLLMLAAYHGHAEAVAVLLARGAEPDRPNDRGQTPLAGAVFKGEDAVVRLLVEAGADPGAGQPTALDAARMFGRADYLQLLEGA
jgi:ankyrin repeat protein